MGIKFVGSGGDYATMQAYAAYINPLVFTGDEYCYVIGEVTDNVLVILNPVNAGAFKLYVLPSSGAELTGALRPIYGGARATLVNNVQFDTCYQIVDSKVCIRGVQLKRGHANGGALVIVSSAGVIEQSILDGRIGAFTVINSGGAAPGKSRLNLVWGNAGSMGLYDTGSGITSDRDTFVDCAQGYRTDYSSGKCVGSVFYNCALDFNGTSIAGSGYNATSNASVSGTGFGANAVTGITGADFVSVTPGSEDFRRAPGSTNLGNNGTTIVGITADIFGTSIPQGGSPDRGAYEYPEAAPSILSIAATMDVFAANMSLAQFVPTSLTITAQIDPFASNVVLGQPPGVINFGPLKNGSNFAWVRNDITAIVQDRATGANVATLVGVSAGPTGGQLSDPLIVPGSLYRVSFRIPVGGPLPNGAKGEADLVGA
jgi:hypothetical protein